MFFKFKQFCDTLNVYTKSSGLNTTQLWLKYGQIQLLCCLDPAVGLLQLSQNNPITGFVHILTSAGLYLTQNCFKSVGLHSYSESVKYDTFVFAFLYLQHLIEFI